MEERNKKTELLVGLFLFVGMLLLALLILQFGSVREMMKDTYEITAPFPDATGVRSGTPVMLGGSRIGKVPRMPELNQQFNGVIVPIEIYHEMRIPSDAKFSIGTSGLLGDSYVEIRPSGKQTGEYIAPGTFVPQSQVSAGSGLNQMQETAAQVGRKVDLVLDDVRAATQALKSSLERVNQGALSNNVIEGFQRSMAHLESTMKDVDEGVLSDENKNNLKTAIADLKEVSSSLKRTSLEIEAQVKRVGPVFDKIEPAIGKFEKVAETANEALNSFKKSGDNLAVFTGNMAKGDGLMKSLLLDKELRNEFKDFVSNLKRNGIYRYKDDAAQVDRGAPPQQPVRRGLFGRD